MKKMIILRFLFIFCAIIFIAPAYAASLDVVTLPRTTIVTLQEPKTKHSYEIHIQLPINYMPEKKYPVVYMTDSPYTFPITTGAARYPANIEKMEDVMYVGISWQSGVSPGFSRQRDYTPTKKVKGYKDPTGDADKHLAFIRQTVFPYIESNYVADANNRTYLGNSYGGLFGAYVLLNEPTTFKNYILGSPSFWWDNKYIFTLEAETKALATNLSANVFISVGELEYANSDSTRNDLLGDAKKFHQRLKDRNLKNMKLQLQVIESANHETAFPTTAIQGLWWLFNKKEGVAI
jgi:predicted alpha/beta superfamily hydrolase